MLGGMESSTSSEDVMVALGLPVVLRSCIFTDACDNVHDHDHVTCMECPDCRGWVVLWGTIGAGVSNTATTLALPASESQPQKDRGKVCVYT